MLILAIKILIKSINVKHTEMIRHLPPSFLQGKEANTTTLSFMPGQRLEASPLTRVVT